MAEFGFLNHREINDRLLRFCAVKITSPNNGICIGRTDSGGCKKAETVAVTAL